MASPIRASRTSRGTARSPGYKNSACDSAAAGTSSNRSLTSRGGCTGGPMAACETQRLRRRNACSTSISTGRAPVMGSHLVRREPAPLAGAPMGADDISPRGAAGEGEADGGVLGQVVSERAGQPVLASPSRLHRSRRGDGKRTYAVTVIGEVGGFKLMVVPTARTRME